jgi:hypothetical protein
MRDSFLQINNSFMDKYKNIFYLLLLTIICTIIIYISLDFSIFYTITIIIIIFIIAFSIIQNSYKNIFDQNNLFIKTKVSKINYLLENIFY